MSVVIQLFAVAVGAIIIVCTVKCLVERTFNEMQAAMWLLAGAAAIVLGLCPAIIIWTAERLGVTWPPAMLFLFALVGVGFIVFKQTRDINALNSRQIELTERVSILLYDLDRACERIDRAAGPSPDPTPDRGRAAAGETCAHEDHAVRCEEQVR